MTTKPRLIPIDKSLADTFAPDDLSVPFVMREGDQCWVKASEFRAWEAAQATAPGIRGVKSD